MAYPPRLQRITTPRDEPEAFQRINVTVESIHYYKDSETSLPLSAVLLNVSFNLQEGEYLGSTRFPLEVIGVPPSQETSSKQNTVPYGMCEMSEEYPSNDQRVHVAGKVTMKSGGREKSLYMIHRRENVFTFQASTIPPKPDEPTSISRNGEPYPKTTRLLIVVCPPDAEHANQPFPWRLWLRPELEIEVFKKTSNLFSRLFSRRRMYTNRDKKHKGWCIDIGGPYKPEIAEEELSKTTLTGPSPSRDLPCGASSKSKRSQAGVAAAQ